MKKLLLSVGLLLTAIVSNAQQGLENIIVEKYYVSNAADSIAASGNGDELPVGSVTYRVFVDMLPGYKFQAAFGTQDNSNIPLHTLILSTTTSFYNNTDRGHEIPSYSKSNAAQNTVMLDSWFSAGAACSGSHGILKADDNSTGGTNVVNASGALQNSDISAGIPLTTADGIYTKTPNPSAVTFVNMAQAQSDFDGGPSSSSFITTNASWASLVGATGPTADNRVLIGQFTTDGCFHFELNIQIGTPAGGTQKYVAANPTGNEILFPACIYPQIANNTASVSIAPTTNVPLCVGTTVTFTATPTLGGNNPSYQWKNNGINVGANSAAYTTTLAANDHITCELTSDKPCVNGSPAISNTISVFALPTVTADNVNGCEGSSIALSGIPAGGTFSVSNPYNGPSASYTYSYTDVNGCSATSALASIAVNPLPLVSASDVSGCNGNSIALVGSPAGGTFSVADPYTGPTSTYTYSYTDGNGCSNTSTVATITVNSLPDANTGPSQNICIGSNVMIGAAPVSGNTYSWLPATDLSSNIVSNPTVNPQTSTVYTLTETVSSTGCTKSNSVSIGVTPAPTSLSTTNNNATNALASWSSVGSGYSYFVEKRLVGAASFDQGWTTSNTSWQFVNMVPNSNYEWHVRTICGPGQFSEWSSLQPFTTIGSVCSNTPSGLFANSITSSSVKLHWNNLNPVPDHYQIRFRVIGTTQWTNLSGLGTSIKRTLTGLAPSANYQWQIRSKCGASAPFNYSNWSTMSTFLTLGSSREAFLAEDISVSVYPNPTTGEFTFEYTSENVERYNMQILDVSGRVLLSNEAFSTEGSNYIKFDLSGYAKGIYILKFKTSTKNSEQRIVVQ